MHQKVGHVEEEQDGQLQEQGEEEEGVEGEEKERWNEPELGLGLKGPGLIIGSH